jgi:hypothetical protein
MRVCRLASNVMYFVVLFRMSLGSDLNITTHPPAVLRRLAGRESLEGSPVFHFNDAESARSIRKDAMANALMPHLSSCTST